jgi:hypothetical protein
MGLKILVSLVRFQFWPNFPPKIWTERKPTAHLSFGIEVKRPVARESVGHFLKISMHRL